MQSSRWVAASEAGTTWERISKYPVAEFRFAHTRDPLRGD
jgi:hypothetical protein